MLHLMAEATVLPDTPSQWGGAAVVSAAVAIGTWAVTQYLALKRAKLERGREERDILQRASKGDLDLDKEEAVFSDKRWAQYLRQVEKKAEQVEQRGQVERERLERRINSLEEDIDHMRSREHECEKSMAVLKEQVVWLRQAAEDKDAVLRANGLVSPSGLNRINERFPTEATVAERRSYNAPETPMKTRREDPPSGVLSVNPKKD